MELPVFNHNQGPVAEAEAKRAGAAAHFLTVQTAALTEIDSALAGYHAALQKMTTAGMLLDDLQRQLDSARAQEEAGETDPLALAGAEAEYAAAAQSRLEALFKAQQALGRLEDAVQSPLTLPAETLRTIEKNPFKIKQ